jgi:hypothetical protein
MKPPWLKLSKYVRSLLLIVIVVDEYQGSNAVFALTNFWEHLFTGKSQKDSGVAEAVQAKNLANAASKISTLEHYIWSTLPNAAKLSNGKTPVAHFDYKAEVDEWIRATLPDLAKKTTYLILGYYPSNMVFFPTVKPFLGVSLCNFRYCLTNAFLAKWQVSSNPSNSWEFLDSCLWRYEC